MRALLALSLATWALLGCEGRILGPRGEGEPVSPVDPMMPIDPGLPPPPPSCTGEQYCVGASALTRLTTLEYAQTVTAAFGTLVAAERFAGLPTGFNLIAHADNVTPSKLLVVTPYLRQCAPPEFPTCL